MRSERRSRGGDQLREYRGKRSFDATPEPSGAEGTSAEGERPRYVIQEHHARRLHWDLRLEHDGVLASWALPRGVPDDPEHNRLAVRTEDHPLEYLDFHGEIPAGSYGAGTMTIWDRGTYEAEKFEEGKVVLRFDGERLRGRYALFRTRGKDWMIHRMDPAEAGREPIPDDVEPMEATQGRLPRDEAKWAFEVRWAGLRALARCMPGHVELLRAGEDVVARYPEIRGIARALGARDALLDGVIVAFDDEVRPSRERLGRRLEARSESAVRRLRAAVPVVLVAFDLLHLDGRSLLDAPYEERRAVLEDLSIDGESWQTPAYHRGDGAALLEASRRRGLEGIVAKRLSSPYRPGARSRDWRTIPA